MSSVLGSQRVFQKTSLPLKNARFTPAALAGLPAIAVPCGFTRSGLPIGLQLIARHFDEATLLRAAYAYEQQSEWGRRRPPGTS